jgi:hypothetical protein
MDQITLMAAFSSAPVLGSMASTADAATTVDVDFMVTVASAARGSEVETFTAAKSSMAVASVAATFVGTKAFMVAASEAVTAATMAATRSTAVAAIAVVADPMVAVDRMEADTGN